MSCPTSLRRRKGKGTVIFFFFSLANVVIHRNPSLRSRIIVSPGWLVRWLVWHHFYYS